jgi:hypothetical protein
MTHLRRRLRENKLHVIASLSPRRGGRPAPAGPPRPCRSGRGVGWGLRERSLPRWFFWAISFFSSET